MTLHPGSPLRVGVLAALLTLAATAGASGATPDVQTVSMADTKGLVTHTINADVVDYQGRKAVKLTTPKDVEDGFALLAGSDFQDGTIEADLALKLLTPPGVRMPGFLGIGFRARQDVSHYELIYIRPGNSRSEDQAMRNHTVQYSAAPGFGWYELRRGWPWVYESHADLDPDGWTHLKIDVTGRTLRVYLNNSMQPTLIVDGMKGEDLRGAVALWGYAGEESYFSNVRVTPVAPQPITNGSDAAGSWKVTFATDAGPFDGTLQLKRDGNALSGTWSGALGDSRPVTGTWRNGYVELSFPAEWPKDRTSAPAGTATARLAGWIDGDGGKGRVTIEMRADGRWTATRTP
jgi:hypothetical protein